MTHMVSSYTSGEWFTASGAGTPLRDASTGEVVAEVSSAGLDIAAAVAHARTVGGPALRALTFHQRALALKALAAALSAGAEEIYAAYPSTGAPNGDARVDVEGGIHVLTTYVKKALKDLPNDTIIIESEAERLTTADFVGQTVLSSREGVAVQINAYNFPVWAMLEKLAPTVLAGLPVIAKPATSTAHIAEIAARLIVGSGALPEGAFQFVGGSTGDLFDHLGGQDVVAFTGSAATAAMLRANPAFTERGAHFNAEADSLNATILGPDATPDTEEFGLFVKGIAREIISKTGQKCTSIRRAFVPEALMDEVVAGLATQLARVVIGDPRTEGVTMGPLVSSAQAQDVAAAVAALAEDADIVIGADGPTLLSGDLAAGAFFAPTVLRARTADAPGLHRTEAFGPVATLFPYAAPADAARLAALGEGSLVASVVTHDPVFAAQMVRALAPYHGRILLVARETARTGMPHGAVLPQLIHGGPGRAGGGEELGGIRGVKALMQATSVAGPAGLLVEVTRTWNSGAAIVTGDVHPFRLHLEDLELGYTLRTASRTITLADIEHFAHFTGDTFYAHMDEEAAAASPIFKGRVAHGYFVIAAAAGLFVDPAPGPVLANFGLDHLRFVQPVYPGDAISLRLTAKHKAQRAGQQWGEVTWDVEVKNQNDEVVATYDLLTINACRPA